jgi:LuxR family maltose regulon positive regulatory protein
MGCTVSGVAGDDGVTPSGAESQPKATTANLGARSADGAGVEPALVERTALLDRMLAVDAPVVAVVAPPGYGKSTLLTQWAARRGPRVAWVACDRIRDDPASWFMAVVAAVTLVEPATGAARELLSEDAGRLVEQLVGLVGALTQPLAIVLDQVEALSHPEGRETIAAFAMALPPGVHLVLGSREEVPFPTGRMRVERRLLEIGPDDLALSRDETSRLLARVGVELSDAGTSQLVWDTEGWPAAIYLAALRIQAGEVRADRPFTGTERLMSDYLHSEVLKPLTRAQRKFLVRTSILDQVSGPLGDAVVGGRGATRVLEGLQRTNGLVLSVDGEGEWYRYHRLLRQALQAELRTEAPDLVLELHARAAVWFETHDEPEQAIDHAYLSGDPHHFGGLVLEAMQQVWASGEIDTVLRWMERLGSRSPAPHTPAMVAHGALLFALVGRPGDAERWAAVAEALPASGTLPDGSTVEATLAYLRANLCRNGPMTMREDSEAALAGLGPASPYRATMHHTEGLSYLLEGDLESADASFAHAYDLAASIETSPVAGLVLTEQFQIAVERDEWTAAESLIKRALEIVGRGPYDEYWTSALVFASAARAAAHRGDMREAREFARRAARLRPLLTYALPVVSVQALVELARAYLALVDPAGARAVLEQVHGILQQRPDLGTLATAARRLEERVSQITAATPVGASSLTAAELRLVPLLPTHLSYPEIGERLFISRHTVKTQASSVYRKLGASSRKEAVDRIVELGLI